MFDFHNLHSLSPLRGSHKKNRGIIPLFADCAIPIFLTYIKQSDLETKNGGEAPAWVRGAVHTLTRAYVYCRSVKR
ncbi:hypothetical protein CKJ90_17185 [Klebsiella pneumoniae]|nr:hypothetical protein CJ430_09125 [Klebsiella pneumoniae]PAT72908.1 hypothetical protein CJ738_09815 [Klebsiella pneumoniae]PAW18188.1 hypothetical protein CKJ90_17185 [Klebsiella pneumoniae]